MYQLIDNQTRWNTEKWERGHVVEYSIAKLVWGFEFRLRKSATPGRPHLTLEDKHNKIIWICDIITRNFRQNGGRPDSTQTFRSLRMAADRYREMYGEN